VSGLQPPGLFAAGRISWLLGIEDTCVYPADAGAATLDEHALTEHDVRMADDLALAARLGAEGLRYGVSWPLVHPAPGRFVWDDLDRAVDEAERQGLALVADLVHYGTPTWLADSFADRGYPDAIAEFAGAFAARYARRVQHITPLNEPFTTASFCGLRGVWPPQLHGWEGWTRVAVPIATGMARATRAIRAAAPDTRVVHVEAATLVSAAAESGRAEAALVRAIGWLPTDLLLGRVDAAHPMRAWLEGFGADPVALDELVDHPAPPDVLGVNYYPDLTPRRIVQLDGGFTQVAYDGGAAGLRRVLRAFADRYALPLALTETSIEGDDDIRRRWLAESVAEVRGLAVGGLDIRGYTWWPLLDFVDWSRASGGRNVEEFAVTSTAADGTEVVALSAPLGDPRDGKSAFLRRMGLVRLDEDAGGRLERVATGAADEYERLAGEAG
jgi:beta-glucosidase